MPGKEPTKNQPDRHVKKVKETNTASNLNTNKGENEVSKYPSIASFLDNFPKFQKKIISSKGFTPHEGHYTNRVLADNSDIADNLEFKQKLSDQKLWPIDFNLLNKSKELYEDKILRVRNEIHFKQKEKKKSDSALNEVEKKRSKDKSEKKIGPIQITSPKTKEVVDKSVELAGKEEVKNTGNTGKLPDNYIESTKPKIKKMVESVQTDTDDIEMNLNYTHGDAAVNDFLFNEYNKIGKDPNIYVTTERDKKVNLFYYAHSVLHDPYKSTLLAPQKKVIKHKDGPAKGMIDYLSTDPEILIDVVPLSSNTKDSKEQLKKAEDSLKVNYGHQSIVESFYNKIVLLEEDYKNASDIDSDKYKEKAADLYLFGDEHKTKSHYNKKTTAQYIAFLRKNGRVVGLLGMIGNAIDNAIRSKILKVMTAGILDYQINKDLRGFKSEATTFEEDFKGKENTHFHHFNKDENGNLLLDQDATNGKDGSNGKLEKMKKGGRLIPVYIKIRDMYNQWVQKRSLPFISDPAKDSENYWLASNWIIAAENCTAADNLLEIIDDFLKGVIAWTGILSAIPGVALGTVPFMVTCAALEAPVTALRSSFQTLKAIYYNYANSLNTNPELFHKLRGLRNHAAIKAFATTGKFITEQAVGKYDDRTFQSPSQNALPEGHFDPEKPSVPDIIGKTVKETLVKGSGTPADLTGQVGVIANKSAMHNDMRYGVEEHRKISNKTSSPEDVNSNGESKESKLIAEAFAATMLKKNEHTEALEKRLGPIKQMAKPITDFSSWMKGKLKSKNEEIEPHLEKTTSTGEIIEEFAKKGSIEWI